MIYLKVIYTYSVRIDGVEVPFSDVFPVGLASFVGKTFLSLQGCLRGSVKKKKKKSIDSICVGLFLDSLFPLIYVYLYASITQHMSSFKYYNSFIVNFEII